MVHFTIVYSDIIPILLALGGVYFLGSGVMDHKNLFMILGVLLFILAVVLPWAIMSVII